MSRSHNVRFHSNTPQGRPTISLSYSQLALHVKRVQRDKRIVGGKAGEWKERLRQLCDLVPEWIQVKGLPVKKGVGAEEVVDKQRRVVYLSQRVSYQSIREKLGAVAFHDGKTIQKADTQSMNQTAVAREETTTTTSSSSSSSRTIPQDRSSSQVISVEKEEEPQPSVLESLQPLTVASPRKGSKWRLSQRSRKKRSNSTTVSPPTRSFLDSSVTQALPSSNRTINQLEQKRDALSLDRNNREDSTEANFEDMEAAALASPSSSLRVNHNQHLMAADAFGGEVITSHVTNPRGLKVMLSKLNAGRRI